MVESRYVLCLIGEGNHLRPKLKGKDGEDDLNSSGFVLEKI